MARQEAVQRFVNDQLQPLLNSVDAVRPLSISLVQATFESRNEEEFNNAKIAITQHLEVAKQKIDLIRDMVDQGEQIYTSLVQLTMVLAKLVKCCLIIFDQSSTPEDINNANESVGQIINEILTAFTNWNNLFTEPLTIKPGATIPALEQKVEGRPSTKVLKDVHQKATTASTYLGSLGTDSFITKDPKDWNDADLRDFLRLWMQMEDPVVAVFGQLSGADFLSLTRDQVFKLATSLPVEKPGDAAMAIIEAIEELGNTDIGNKCSIPEAELNFMNRNELLGTANQLANDLAAEINRFTEGFKLIQMARASASPKPSEQSPTDQNAPEVNAASPQPELTPEQLAQYDTNGRRICNDAISKIQQAYHDIVCVTQYYAKKIDDSFLVQSLLSQVNQFELVSVQFQASIAALANATTDDPAITMQLQATAKSFAASLGNTLEEMFRIRSELEDQQQKAKKLEEDRKRLQAARRAPGRRHLHQLDPSMVAQPVTSFQPTTQTPQQQTVAVSQSQATPPIPIATQPQPEAQSGRQPSINDSQVNQLWIGRQRPQIHQRVQSTIISPTTTQTGGIYQPSPNLANAPQRVAWNYRPVSTPVQGLAPIAGQQASAAAALPNHPSLHRSTSATNIGPFQRSRPNKQRPQSVRIQLAPTRRASVSLPISQNQPLQQHASLSPAEHRLSLMHSNRESVDLLPKEFAGNIWAEREYDPKFVIFDGERQNKDELSIRAASLNQLIMRLTSTRVVDLDFVNTFLLTYHSFTTPEEVMLKLEERYFVPDSVPLPEETKRTLQLKVVNFLKKWIIERAHDFNESLLRYVHEFTEMMKEEGQAGLAQQIEIALQKLKQDVQQRNEQLTHAANGLFLKMKNIGRKNEALHQFVLRVSAEKLAEHLSIVDMTIFRRIQPSELLGKAWSKSDGKKRSPNVMQLINRFNNVSAWVASCILWCEKLKDRVTMVKKFLKIMAHLDKINNFNCVMAILAGLSNAAVHRLKFTMDELSESYKQEWNQFQEMMSSDNNYRLYRERLHKATPPVMPYLGLYLTDITFIEDGNPDEYEGLINFRKRELAYRVIEEIQRFQQTPYKTVVDPTIFSAVQELPCNNDDELYALSLQREPRGTQSKASLA